MSKRGKYRPVETRVWADARFMTLSDDGKLLWFYLLTAPETCPIPGVIIGSQAVVADGINWSVPRLQKGYAELLTKGLSVRQEGRITWLPNALKLQPIAGPTAMVCMSKFWGDIPECTLKVELWEALEIACKSWSQKFAKLFAKPHAIHHQIPHAMPHAMGEDTGSGSGTATATGIEAPPDLAVLIARAAIAEINRLAKKNYRPDSEEVVKNCKSIAQANHTADDARLVVQSKRHWLGEDNMRRQFTPSVLLRPRNFKRYLEDINASRKPVQIVMAAVANDDDEAAMPWSEREAS